MIDQVMRTDAVHTLAEAAQSAPSQLLVKNDLMAEVATHAAQLCGYVRAQQAERPGLAPDLRTDILLFAPTCFVGHHFRLDETRCCVAEHRKVVVHPWRDIGARRAGLGGRRRGLA